ncbi:HAMP domain-containing sensor histidine kinase [Streptomyces sp. NPDC089799]|uniref:sensor histidine kinase n=1 Tax=Streptomyces sp. NPDC089799 TaxID=3155066 RepID=UPI003421E008
MPAIARLAGHGARRRLPRRTVRLRMTLLYGGLFVLSGAALLGVTYVLVHRAIAGQPLELSVSGPGREPGVIPAQPPRSRQDDLKTLSDQAQDAMAGQIADVMHQLLVQSGIALALMLAVSIVLGWMVAGRMLRPLRTITTTVQEISATSLHQRLALDGPSDELKELGDTFDGLLSRLETSFEAHRQFVANASHELRTPLARQRALGQVALSDPGATVESLRQAHERILAAGARQERLIEALLMLARGHAGIEVRRPFDLTGIVREVVEARADEADLRTVTVHTSYATAVAPGHRPLAERLVVNLVDNALRHNSPHGEVRVTTGTVDGHAVLTVTNTGPPVPPEAVGRLFQPFQRLGATRVARTEGLGLGLSIVQAIADAHDAGLTTSTRPGGGLSVTVTFPTTSDSAPAARRRPPLSVH